MNPYKNIWGRIISLPESVKIGAFVDIGEPNIGEDCKIQCFVSIPPGWKIGNRVFIGPGARFANDKHPRAIGGWELTGGVVEDDVTVGMNATILPVNLGRGCKIGAGAVVTRDVPEGETWVGNPAKVLL